MSTAGLNSFPAPHSTTVPLRVTLADDFGRPYGHGWHRSRALKRGRSMADFPSLSAANTSAVRAYRDTAQPSQISSPRRTPIPIQTYSNQPADNVFRLLDTYASVEFLGQQFSFGKQSYWWGPGSASAMMLSDDAEPFYSFRINRTLPLYIPLVSRLLGPFRYDNFFGKLSGHMYPRQPYFYGQKITSARLRTWNWDFPATRSLPAMEARH